MEKIDYIIGILITLLGIAAATDMIINEIRGTRNTVKHDLETHQKWLFDALYSMNNKVVLPEPKIENEIIEPAKIYSPSIDPVNSLKGMRNDWHGFD